MAWELQGKIASFEAANDLSALQYTAVKMATGSKVDAFAADTDLAVGILQNKPTAGQTAEVQLDGVSKMVFSGSIAVGVMVHGSSTGRATSIATAKYILGQVVETAANDGELGSVLITNPGSVKAA